MHEYKSNDGYQPVEVPAGEELLSVYKICLAAADKAFTVNLWHTPLPMLATIIGVLIATDASTTIPDQSKARVTEALRYMAERLGPL